ncbi:MAG: FAD-dependent oxidoreductase [Oscillospiraceae bacterium]|nr:FAD-dependent oxidoreductase [Oscillospiraceae bacterium]
MNRLKYVIIGNSAAGIGAIEGIRQIDKSGEITVITNEPYHTYSRPLISYLLQGKVSEQGMDYRDRDFYADNKITLVISQATRVEPESKQVLLADGGSIPYDKLLIAAGSSAFVPPIEGLETVDRKHTFVCYDDAKQLDRSLKGDERVLIVGGGLVGLKCAEGILSRVSAVTVVDLAPMILSSILNQSGAEMVQTHLQDKGIEFILSSGIKKFDRSTAILQEGGEIEFDILVLAVGMRPNTALLDGIAKIERGIVIDKRSQTIAPDIYAAGDCTQTTDISCGQDRVMALLPTAYMQGECAGINMAGGDKIFDRAFPMNAIGFCGLHIITAGSYIGDVYTEDAKGSYKRLFYSNNRLCGYILIGNIDKAGIYTSLIREQTPLDTIDFGLICERPGLMAFCSEDRSNRLGGVSE